MGAGRTAGHDVCLVSFQCSMFIPSLKSIKDVCQCCLLIDLLWQQICETSKKVLCFTEINNLRGKEILWAGGLGKCMFVELLKIILIICTISVTYF